LIFLEDETGQKGLNHETDDYGDDSDDAAGIILNCIQNLAFLTKETAKTLQGTLRPNVNVKHETFSREDCFW